MPRTSGSKNYFSFVKGLNTEAGPLTFPEDTSKDEQNFTLNRDGSRRKRLGLDWEKLDTGYQTSSITEGFSLLEGTTAVVSFDYLNKRFSSHIIWKDIFNDGAGVDLLAVGYRSEVFFYDISGTNTVDINTNFVSSINLNSHSINNSNEPLWQANTAYSYGDFVVNGGNLYFCSTAGTSAGAGGPTGTGANISDNTCVWNYRKVYYEKDIKNISFARIGNVLIINSPQIKPVKVKVTSDGAGGFTVGTPTELSIKIRDFEGVDDTFSVDFRPFSKTALHVYNLVNQGWFEKNIDAFTSTNTVTISSNSAANPTVITTTVAHQLSGGQTVSISGSNSTPSIDGQHVVTVISSTTFSVPVNVTVAGTIGTVTKSGDIPSNSDMMKFALDTNHNFSAAQMEKQLVLNSPAPKGHFILDLFTKQRSNAFNLDINTYTNYTTDDIPDDPSTSGITDVASFLQRVWYAKEDTLYFTKIYEVEADIEVCHQVADPTSEHISDLVASDGGTIKIKEASTIKGIAPFGSGALVFTDVGIFWVGGADTAFKADSFVVKKISNHTLIDAGSIVETPEGVFAFCESGVVGITTERISGDPSADNLSINTIQTEYISNFALDTVNGTFDKVNNKVYWVVERTGKVLVLDLVLGAFYKYNINGNHLGTNSQAMPCLLSPIFVGSYSPNFDGSGTSTNKEYIKWLCGDLAQTGGAGSASTANLLFAELNQTDFKDFETHRSANSITTFSGWPTGDTVNNVQAYLETGYELLGDAQRNKQATYVHCFFNKTETAFNGENVVNPSGCLLQAKWDWSDHINSGKEAPSKEVYRFRREYISTDGTEFNSGTPLVKTKNKVRGTGKSLRLRFETEDGKDCWLLGWSINFTGKSIA